MNRKLLPLLTALTVAAFIAFLGSSAAASARIPALRCGQDPCHFGLSGQALELDFGGNRIRCRSLIGHGNIGRSYGSAVLDLQNCREQVTVFNFRCSSSVAQVGPVHTSLMGTELRLGTGKVPKVMFLELRATFRCSPAMKFYVEGFVVGHLDRAQCNTKNSKYQLEPVLFAHGGIGDEPAYDIYVDARANTYKVPTPWQMKFRREVTLRC